jgi:hypothetical protein
VPIATAKALLVIRDIRHPFSSVRPDRTRYQPDATNVCIAGAAAWTSSK